VIGGGVSANSYLMKNLEELAQKFDIKFLGSSRALATDNAVMIGVAGFFAKPKPLSSIKATGNLPIER
jgi:tRNA A37 threonylcarbamoyltransferase TsaD